MALFSTLGNMISQQRDASSLDAIVTYMLEWTQTLNEINSQYADTKQSDEACFQEELGLLLEKQNSLRNELQRIEKRLQHVRSNYNTVVKDREQADATRVEAHVKTLSEYDVSLAVEVSCCTPIEKTFVVNTSSCTVYKSNKYSGGAAS